AGGLTADSEPDLRPARQRKRGRPPSQPPADDGKRPPPACSDSRTDASWPGQVGEQVAKLAVCPCAQYVIDPVTEGVVGQAALGIAVPEFGEGLFPLGIGYPDMVQAPRGDIVRNHHTWIIGPDSPCDNPPSVARRPRPLMQPDPRIEDRVEDIHEEVCEDH